VPAFNQKKTLSFEEVGDYLGGRFLPSLEGP